MHFQAYSLHYYASESEKSLLFHPDIDHDSSLRPLIQFGS